MDSSKNNLKLVQLVRENPCIWDRNHRMHNNADHVKTVWNKIADRFGQSLQKTRAKWKNLRDSYRLQLYKKLEALQNDNAKEVEISWPLFDEMSFLQEHMCRKSTSKVKGETKPKKVKLLDHSYFEDDVENDAENDEEDELISNSSIKHIEMVTVDDFDASVLDYLNENASQQAPCKKQSILVSSNSTEDEDRCFFDSLLPYMKLLPPKDKMLCRMRIQEVIFSIAFPSGKKENGSRTSSNFEALT